MNIRISLLFTAIIPLAVACGGGLPGLGGGGGGSSASDGNPAEVRLQAEPRTLDSGDLTTIEIRITDVQKPFVLKVRHHESLSFVPKSMILYGDGNPGPNIPTPSDFGTRTSTRYLVVPFYEVLHFGKHGKGTLTFNFQAAKASNENLEIDVDDFETTALGSYFDSNNPRFSTLDEVRIRVREDESDFEEIEEIEEDPSEDEDEDEDADTDAEDSEDEDA